MKITASDIINPPAPAFDEEYTGCKLVVSPSHDDFLNNTFARPTKFSECWWCPFFGIWFRFQKALDFEIFDSVREYLAIRQCKKNNEQSRKASVVATVHSYKKAMEKFNHGETVMMPVERSLKTRERK